MDALIPDDPSTLFLLGVVLTAVGFWIKDKLDALTSTDRKTEARVERSKAQTSDLRVDLAGIEARLAAFEHRLECNDRQQEMVTRLDERMANLTDEIKRQPQIIALCVGEAIKAALRYGEARAGG